MHPSVHGPVARKIVCVCCVPRETIQLFPHLIWCARRSAQPGEDSNPRVLSRSSSIRHKGNLWRRAHKKTRRIINSNLFVGAGIWVIINARAQQGGQNGADTLLAKIQLLICHSGQAPSGRYLQRKRDSLQHLLHAAFYTNTLRLIKIVASLKEREREFPRRLPQLANSPRLKSKTSSAPAAEQDQHAEREHSVLSLAQSLSRKVGYLGHLIAAEMYTKWRAGPVLCVCGWRRKNKF